MKLKHALLTFALAGASLSSLLRSQPDPTPTPLGTEKTLAVFNNILVRNLQDEPLGRISDLGIDLVNGRIVVVLIVTDESLTVARKIVAVPPGALIPDAANHVYR